MTLLADPAKEILKKHKEEKTSADKVANAAVKAEAKTERLKAWKRPSSDKERKDKKAERQADWEARR